MGFRTELYNYVSQSRIVRAQVSDRVYPGIAPQDVSSPYIVFHLVSSVGENHLTNAASLVHEVWQFNCFADTDETCDAMKEALRETLDGFYGDLNGVEIARIVFSSNYDISSPPEFGNQKFLFGQACQFEIHYHRSVPNPPLKRS